MTNEVISLLKDGPKTSDELAATLGLDGPWLVVPELCELHDDGVVFPSPEKPTRWSLSNPLASMREAFVR